jgi:hypothetical protein
MRCIRERRGRPHHVGVPAILFGEVGSGEAGRKGAQHNAAPFFMRASLYLLSFFQSNGRPGNVIGRGGGRSRCVGGRPARDEPGFSSRRISLRSIG